MGGCRPCDCDFGGAYSNRWGTGIGTGLGVKYGVREGWGHRWMGGDRDVEIEGTERLGWKAGYPFPEMEGW